MAINVLLQRIGAEELAESAKCLPPLPRTTSQIIAIPGVPLFNVQDLIKVITLDPTLTANLLQVANSASYSTSRPAASVGNSVVRLGTGTIMAYALSVSAWTREGVDLSSFGLTTKEYWRHWVGTVAAAEELKLRGLARSGFSAAALLHDIGKLILIRHMTAQRLEQMTAFRTTYPGHRTIAAENKILGSITL